MNEAMSFAKKHSWCEESIDPQTSIFYPPNPMSVGPETLMELVQQEFGEWSERSACNTTKRAQEAPRYRPLSDTVSPKAGPNDIHQLPRKTVSFISAALFIGNFNFWFLGIIVANYLKRSTPHSYSPSQQRWVHFR